MANALAALIRLVLRELGRLFYPQIERRGELPDGPLLVAINHPNGLLDGLVLALAVERPLAFVAKSTFFANPFLRPILVAFGAVPIYRPADRGKPGWVLPGTPGANDATFAAARALLAGGGALAIFPEGTPSHGRELLPLKTGAARIALGAEAEANWMLGLQVVPVALWFEEQIRAGTRALVLIGPPIAVAALCETYQADPLAATHTLTEQIRVGLLAGMATAAQVGHSSAAQPTRAALRGMGLARTLVCVLLLAFGAPLALIGFMLALPGRAIARVILSVLALRHRATVGTARLVALVLGLGLGWLGLGLVVAGVLDWSGIAVSHSMLRLYGLLGVLLAGPLLGYLGLRWQRLWYTGLRDHRIG